MQSISNGRQTAYNPTTNSYNFFNLHSSILRSQKKIQKSVTSISLANFCNKKSIGSNLPQLRSINENLSFIETNFGLQCFNQNNLLEVCLSLHQKISQGITLNSMDRDLLINSITLYKYENSRFDNYLFFIQNSISSLQDNNLINLYINSEITTQFKYRLLLLSDVMNNPECDFDFLGTSIRRENILSNIATELYNIPNIRRTLLSSGICSDNTSLFNTVNIFKIIDTIPMGDLPINLQKLPLNSIQNLLIFTLRYNLITYEVYNQYQLINKMIGFILNFF